MSPCLNTLKVIFFDIDDTLYSASEFARLARLNSIQAMINMGLKMEREQCYRELVEVIEEFGSNFEHHYDKLLVRIPKEAYQGINPAILIAAGVVAYHHTKSRYLRPYPDVRDTFRWLSRTDLQLGIITAGLEVKQAEKLIRLRLLKYINPAAIFITGQLGIGKQNAKLYQHACQTLRLQPAECMYVGDNALTDVDVPNSLGMVTVLHQRGGKYLTVPGKTIPKHTVHNMEELVGILQQYYGVQSRK